MDECNKKFIDYWYSVFFDSILFDKNGVMNLNIYIEDLVKDEYLNGLLNKLKSIKETKSYPLFAFEKISEIINMIKLKKNNEIINKIEEEYNELKKIELNNDFVYYQEAMLKFLDLNHVKSFNDYELNYENIEKSVVFDYITLFDLVSSNINIIENDLFVASIKKFFADCPEMFLDEKINKRAVEILNKNINNKDSMDLLYKIENGYLDGFLFQDIKGIYDTVLIQNMLFDKDLVRERASLLDSNQIGTVYYFISNGAIYDKNIKDNFYMILSEYRSGTLDKLPKEQKKKLFERNNKYIGMLNGFNNYNSEMLTSDLINRFDSTVSLLKAKDLNFKVLFKTDLDVLNYLIYGKELDEISDYVFLSINKFYKIVPCIFDNQQIYSRTLELINNNKNKKNKKIIKKIQKDFER